MRFVWLSEARQALRSSLRPHSFFGSQREPVGKGWVARQDGQTRQGKRRP